MAFLKRISAGRGRLSLPLPPEPPLPLGGGVASPGPSPLPLRQDAYSTRRLQQSPLRAPRDVVILIIYSSRRAPGGRRRQPDRGPIQKNRRRHARGAGPNAPEARGRSRRTRRGKVGRAVGRGHAAARAWQGAHGRAGHREGARDRCRLRPDAIAPRPGRFGG